MTYELGTKPERLRVVLTRGSDFHQQVSLVNAAADFDGVPPLLVFGSRAFEAVLVQAGKVADFFLLATDVATLAAADGREVVLEHLGAVIARGKYEVI